MKTRTLGFLLTLSLSLLALCLLLAALGGLSPRSTTVLAQGPDGYAIYYVAPDCTGIDPPCYTVVQDAVDAVDDPGDVVQVAQGIYSGVHAREGITGVVHLTKTVTVRGGFSPDFAAWDPKAYPTVLDAQREGHVFYVGGAGTSVIEGLQIANGDAEVGGGHWGGGLLAIGGSGPSLTVTLSYNQVLSNHAPIGFGGGGGLAAMFSNVYLADNRFEHNEAGGVGGAMRLEQANAHLRDNVIRHNQAGSSGGGIYLAYLTNVSMTNTVLADNGAGFAGGGMVAAGSYLHMRHTTVARNASGDGSGLYVTSGGIHGTIVSTVRMTDTLFADHTVGLTITAAPPFFTNTVVLDTTLWDGAGLLAGGDGDLTLINTHVGDPAFTTDGYHLTPASDAVDLGIDAGVRADLDGQPRPMRAGFDIGADELGFRAYLPLILRTHTP
jgi:hypothetical protein